VFSDRPLVVLLVT